MFVAAKQKRALRRETTMVAKRTVKKTNFGALIEDASYRLPLATAPYKLLE